MTKFRVIYDEVKSVEYIIEAETEEEAEELAQQYDEDDSLIPDNVIVQDCGFQESHHNYTEKVDDDYGVIPTYNYDELILKNVDDLNDNEVLHILNVDMQKGDIKLGQVSTIIEAREYYKEKQV
jgi:hypothetical protein